MLSLDWDDANRDHIARHGINPSEVEEVLSRDPHDLGYREEQGELRFSFLGETARGKNTGSRRHRAWRPGEAGDGFRTWTVFDETLSAEQKSLMNTNGRLNTTRVVPHFDSEADEARWWFEHKDLIEQDFLTAFDNGTIGSGRSLRYAVAAATTSVPISLDPADAILARELAAKTGESYQDFVRRVVHQALELEKTA